MTARDVRRALLRAALVALIGVALLLAWGAVRERTPGLALLVTATCAGAVMLPMTWLEASAARRAAALRPWGVFAPAWALGSAAVVVLFLEHEYVASLVAGRSLDESLADALDRALGATPFLELVVPLVGWFALPVGAAASMHVRGPDAYAPGLLLLVIVGVPFLCLGPGVLATFVLVAPTLLGAYSAADRLERRWRRWRDREAIEALRARLEGDEGALARARLLAHLGDDVACGALALPDPDDNTPDPAAWAKGLLAAGPRLVGRAALGAAGAVITSLEPVPGARAEEALLALGDLLAASEPAAVEAAGARARDAVRLWAEALDPARRAVVEAVHAVAEGRPWCGVDAVRAAIQATGDVELVRAAIRAAVEPHLDELRPPTAPGPSS